MSDSSMKRCKRVSFFTDVCCLVGLKTLGRIVGFYKEDVNNPAYRQVKGKKQDDAELIRFMNLVNYLSKDSSISLSSTVDSLVAHRQDFGGNPTLVGGCMYSHQHREWC